MNDLRFALRSLARSPGFTAVVVVTLALGIGLSTTIFNGVNPLLFRSLPFEDPERLVALAESNPKQGQETLDVAYADFLRWRDESTTFSRLAIWTDIHVALTAGDQPENVNAYEVSASLFGTLGLQPALGRDFLPKDEQPGSDRVALISDRLWHRSFGGAPGILGRTVQLNGTPYTVIGVMPPGVQFRNFGDLWVPLVVDAPERTRGRFNYEGVGRLRPGVTLAQASSDLNAIQARIAQESPLTNRGVGAVVRPFSDVFLDAGLRSMGWTMFGAVVFVLAIACANVAGLFLARAVTRQKEFAVRAALGAGCWPVLRQLLVESVLITGVAGGLALMLSSWGTGLIVGLVPIEIPYWIDFSMDWRVFAFAVGVSALTSVLFGVIPASQAARADVLSGLRESSRGSSGGRQGRRLRHAFVVSEVALTTLLLFGTGLMIRSLQNLQRVDPGFDPERLVVFYLDSSARPGTTAQARIVFYDRLIERLNGAPGIAAAAACSRIPLSGGSTGQAFVVEGRAVPPGEPRPVGNLRCITPGYFSAMRIPLLAGRDFSAEDNAASRKVLIVDAAFARQYFGDRNPLGQRLWWNPADPLSAREIVGVAADVKHTRLDAEARPGFYMPYAQNPRQIMGVVVRTVADDPAAAAKTIRAAVRETDPSLPVIGLKTMRERMGETFWIRSYLGKLLVGFAALALALTALGIASVIAYAVAQRTREIGVRIALGALPADVLRLVLAQGLRLVGSGLAFGLVASLGLTRVLGSQLYGVGWFDPLTSLASGALLVAAALLACWLPARRATRIDPVEALRAE